MVRWAVAKNIRSELVEKSGNIEDYQPASGEIVMLYLLPKDAPFVMPSDVRESFVAATAQEGDPATGGVPLTSAVVEDTPSSQAPATAPSTGAAP